MSPQYKRNRQLVFTLLFTMLVGGVILFLSSKKEVLQKIGQVSEKQNLRVRRIASDQPVIGELAKSSVLSPSQEMSDEEQGQKFIKCLHQIIKEAVDSCDEDCVIQFLQKNGSHEAHKYISEGFFRNRGQEIKNIKSPQTKLGRFQVALYQANLLSGPTAQNKNPDYLRAEAMLSSLISEEPENAALYLYLAVVYFDQKRLSEATNTLERMNQKANYYDEYELSWRADYAKSKFAIDSALMTEAYETYSYPRFRTDVDSVIAMQEQLDFDFKPLGQIMTKDAIEQKLVYNNEPNWDHLQYDIGLRMQYYSKQTPTWRKNPERKLPTTNELHDRYLESGRQFSDEISEIRGELQAALARNCSQAVYEAWWQKYPEARIYGR